MKLKLGTTKNIQILTVSESVSLDNFKVLKAGITKLFKSGKNRLILEFTNSNDLQNDILRELAVLNIYARELSGEIILTGISENVKNKIDHFALPPIINCFLTTQKGLEYFEKLHSPLDSSDKPILLTKNLETEQSKVLKDSTENHSQKDSNEKQNEILQYKSKIKQTELSMTDLRKQIEQLKNENGTLKEQLYNLIIERRLPPNTQSYQDKIKDLEIQIEKAHKKST